MADHDAVCTVHIAAIHGIGIRVSVDDVGELLDTYDQKIT